MKRIFSMLLGTLGFLYTLNAQEAEVGGVIPESFSGIRAADNGELYYVATLETTSTDTTNLVLHVFDRGMQPIQKTIVAVPQGTHIAAFSFTGQFFIVSVVNPAMKTRTTLLIDRAGNIVNRKQETDIKYALLSREYFPSIYPVSMNEFLFVRPAGNKKQGFHMEVFDGEMNSRWHKSYGTDSDPASIQDLKMEVDRIYITKKEKKEGKEVYSVQSMNGISGDIFYDTELRQGDNIGVPGFINVMHGFTTTAGVYYSQNNASKKPEGIFLSRIDPSGQIEKMQFIPWAMAKVQAKSDIVSELESGKSGILLHDVVIKPNEEGFILLGEMYRKTSGTEPNTAIFSIQNYSLVSLNKDMQIDKITSFAVPSREVLIKGARSAETGQELAQWLDNNNFFSFRELIPVTGKNVIVYKGNEGGKTMAYFATIDSTGAVPKDNIASIDIDRVQSSEKNKKNDKNTSVNRIVLNATDEEIEALALDQLSKDIIKAQEGHVLMYNYTQPSVRLWLQPVDVR